MAWYIRKAIKLGPFRVNLAKSGVGVSLGVKGARVGIDALKRLYVHLGRSGLYFRKVFSKENR